jgi:hypothetical protein
MDNPEDNTRTEREAALLPPLLRIEDIADAPLTPEPDDAELAAQALLALLADKERRRGRVEPSVPGSQPPADSPQPKEGTREYYEALAVRIRRAHETERRAATRATAYCEQQLKQRQLPEDGDGSLAYMERVLYKHLDTVEREGGELKRRWQHCLAEVMVRRLTIDH